MVPVNVESLTKRTDFDSHDWTNIRNGTPIQEDCKMKKCTYIKHVRIALDAELKDSHNIGNLQAPIYGSIPNMMDPGRTMSNSTPFRKLKEDLYSTCCNGNMLINISDLTYKIGSNLAAPFLSGEYSMMSGADGNIPGMNFRFHDRRTSIIRFPRDIYGDTKTHEIMTQPDASAAIIKSMDRDGNVGTDGIQSMMSKYMGDCGQSLAILANPNQANVFGSMDTLACLNHIMLSTYVGNRAPAVMISSKFKSIMYYPTGTINGSNYTNIYKNFIGKNLVRLTQDEMFYNNVTMMGGHGHGSNGDLTPEQIVKQRQRLTPAVLNKQVARNILNSIKNFPNPGAARRALFGIKENYTNNASRKIYYRDYRRSWYAKQNNSKCFKASNQQI